MNRKGSMTTEENLRVVCEQCGYHAAFEELLMAPNPFAHDEKIKGCPQCCAVDSYYFTCDEAGCWNERTSGTPTPIGYRRTCWDHSPFNPKRNS